LSISFEKNYSSFFIYLALLAFFFIFLEFGFAEGVGFGSSSYGLWVHSVADEIIFMGTRSAFWHL